MVGFRKTNIAMLALAAALAACSEGSLCTVEPHKLWLQRQSDALAVVHAEDDFELSTTAAKELSEVAADTVFVHKCQLEKPDAYKLVKAQKSVHVYAANSTAALYAAFHLQRLNAVNQDFTSINECPSYDLRLLNHWDNLDGTVERGYAGRSIFDWEALADSAPDYLTEYARANASVGINAVVLNNVNASPEILTSAYIARIKRVADVLRNYGVRVAIAVNFASPMKLASLPTADPLDDDVKAFWQSKVDEIYDSIPDFVGFLVKANSEGLPGPLDFGRSHSDGANMLAKTLASHGGIVMWRAFVYSPSDADRAKQANIEFVPLDGAFEPNVIIQIKNGPIDFQPREPFSPLFGNLASTSMMVEFQITQEYTGFSNHLCYLAPMWTETLRSNTHSAADATIAAVTRREKTTTAIAGVANIGNDENWCGGVMAQANWYAFGRLAWNVELSCEEIADEWIAQTFAGLPTTQREAVKEMMMASREAVVNYMMPLGLHHLFAFGHHYGPEPWCDVPGAREDWMPRYYHRADSLGLGFDRSSRGSNAVGQYHSPLAEKFDDIATCPLEYLLWFHHVPWNATLSNGRSLWAELCSRYQSGLEAVHGFVASWRRLRPYIDQQTWTDIAQRLDTQHRDARWWHDACLLYFQQFSAMPIPQGTELDLEKMKRYKLEISNFECPTEEQLFR